MKNINEYVGKIENDGDGNGNGNDDDNGEPLTLSEAKKPEPARSALAKKFRLATRTKLHLIIVRLILFVSRCIFI